MQLRTGGRGSVFLATRAILMATALMGVGAGVAPPALAHEVTPNQVTAHHTAGRPPIIGSRTLEIAGSHFVRDPIPFDTAILRLFCFRGWPSRRESSAHSYRTGSCPTRTAVGINDCSLIPSGSNTEKCEFARHSLWYVGSAERSVVQARWAERPRCARASSALESAQASASVPSFSSWMHDRRYSTCRA
jgi:hypothetical protein